MADPRDNLKPWPKGQSGNPAGSSKKQRLTNALLKMLDDKDLDAAFIKAGMAEALKGDFNFWRYIFERIDGKIADKLEVEERTEKVIRVAEGRRRRKADDDDTGGGNP